MFKNIFDIHDTSYKITQNNQFTFKRLPDVIEATVTSPDPVLILDTIKTDATHIMLTVSIQSQKNAVFQLFFKENNSDKYNESNSYHHRLKEGENNFRFILNSKYLNNDLRIDFSNKTGQYKIKTLTIREIKP
jgi:hypothetical protein